MILREGQHENRRDRGFQQGKANGAGAAPGGKDGGAIETGKRASDYLRQDDYLGLGKDGRLYVLLPNTSLKNAGVAVSRLAECGIRTEAAAMKNEETA